MLLQNRGNVFMKWIRKEIEFVVLLGELITEQKQMPIMQNVFEVCIVYLEWFF